MNPYEMTQELQQAWLDFDVDLRGLTVYTEAATGPYAVTAVLAAMAGAKVYALAKDSAYGSADQAEQETRALSKSAKVDARIQFVREKKEADLAEVDVVTNCGHVRPIDAKMIESLTHPSVVIPLMYEGWEFRPSEIDLEACRKKDIPVGGTNESHPQIGFGNYLGEMAVKLMKDHGFEAAGSRVALCCDNPFAPFLAKALAAVGVKVVGVGPETVWLESKNQLERLKSWSSLSPEDLRDCNALFIAASPQGSPAVIGSPGTLLNVKELSQAVPSIKIFQFAWGGSVDYAAVKQQELAIFPDKKIATGHMAVLPSELGWKPVIRLQTGGLKVAELLYLAKERGCTADEAVEDLEKTGFGSRIESGVRTG